MYTITDTSAFHVVYPFSGTQLKGMLLANQESLLNQERLAVVP